MSLWWWVIFSVVGCSFVYPCWTGTACCSLLTWAETKWVRQLVIHGAIINSINMVITRISRGISQLQIPHRQGKDPQKRNCSHPEDSPAHSLRSCRIWIFFFFLRAVRFSLTWLDVFTQQFHVSFKISHVLLVQGSGDLSSILEYRLCQAVLAL